MTHTQDYTPRRLEKYGIRTGPYTISAELFGAGGEGFIDYIIGTDMIVHQARLYVWSEHLGVVEVSLPSSWWQRFKEQHFPAWALRVMPVRKISHTIRASALFPDYKPPVGVGFNIALY